VAQLATQFPSLFSRHQTQARKPLTVLLVPSVL